MPSSTSVPHNENPDAQLAAALGARTRFRNFVHVPEARSTQELGASAEGSGLVWADHQTAGRGRQGREWRDQRGRDLAVSFRLERLHLPHPGRLAAAAPVAIARALTPLLGRAPRIKWPNDIYVDGRKLSGLLIDALGPQPSSPTAKPSFSFVLGIGININGDRLPEELSESATSLALLTGKEWDRHALVLALAEALESVVRDLEADRVESVASEFATGSQLLGKRVRLEGPPGNPRGLLEHLDLDHAVLASHPPFSLGTIRQMRI